jgi:YD repeat-containing protein
MGNPDVWPFIQGSTNFTMKFDYDGTGNMIYCGWAQTMSASSDPTWRIMQQTFNGSNQMTDIKWPNGSTAFGFIWDNRASLSFS